MLKCEEKKDVKKIESTKTIIFQMYIDQNERFESVETQINKNKYMN